MPKLRSSMSLFYFYLIPPNAKEIHFLSQLCPDIALPLRVTIQPISHHYCILTWLAQRTEKRRRNVQNAPFGLRQQVSVAPASRRLFAECGK